MVRFGSGALVFTPLINSLMEKFSKMPEYLGTADQVRAAHMIYTTLDMYAACSDIETNDAMDKTGYLSQFSVNQCATAWNVRTLWLFILIPKRSFHVGRRVIKYQVPN